MSRLRKEIQQREQEMQLKRNELRENFSLLKNKLSSPPVIGATLLGSAIAGFMLPRRLFSRKKSKQVVPSTPPTQAEQITPEKRQSSRLHSLRFLLIDVVAIIAAITSIKESFRKVSHWLHS